MIFNTLFSAIAILVYIAFVSSNNNENHRRRFIEFVNDDGAKYIIDTDSKPIAKDQIIKLSICKFLLYTRRNPDDAQYLITDNPNSIKKSYFNPNCITVVIVHGWLGSSNSLLNAAIKDPLLKKSCVNVIVMDWSLVSHLEYATSTLGVPIIGNRLGQFLKYLAKLTGASYSDIHLVGHSLGAHVVGNAGRFLDGKVARITGLDPADPLWRTNPDKLNATNAIYVEAIHTNVGILGIKKSVGDVDFYPNGGKTQPGCSVPACSHTRSWELFSATLKYHHLDGCKCSSLLEMELNLCSDSTMPMGNNDLNKFGFGIYRLETCSEYPY